MNAVLEGTQATFYRGFLMARGNFQPQDFGVDMGKDEFIEQIVDDFANVYRGQLTIDELLLRPASALRGTRRLSAWVAASAA